MPPPAPLARRSRLRVRLTAQEHDALAQAAALDGRPLATFARGVLLGAAQRRLNRSRSTPSPTPTTTTDQHPEPPRP